MGKHLVLIENRQYFESNCFLSQLSSAMQHSTAYKFQLIQFSLLKRLPRHVVQLYFTFATRNNPRVTLILKQRTINREIDRLASWLRDTPIYVYDQDPWESYIDSSESKGAYDRIVSHLNCRKIIVTSEWWKNWVGARLNCQVEFFRMGISSRICDGGKPFASRGTSLGFRGLRHPHREAFFREIKRDFGLDVEFLSSTDTYAEYLSYLGNLQIMIHEETGYYICDGVAVQRNAGLWIRDLEAAALGCFVIREYNEDSISYGIEKIPLIRLYQSRSEIPGIISTINSLSAKEKLEIQRQSVNEIRNRRDWDRFLEIIASDE
jgi:hypothetical protein